MAQADDSVCRKVMDYCHTQWPQKSSTDPLLGLYWKVRDSLSIHNDLLMYNLHIVVPSLFAEGDTTESPRGTPRDCPVQNEDQDVGMVAWNIETGRRVHPEMPARIWHLSAMCFFW